MGNRKGMPGMAPQQSHTHQILEAAHQDMPKVQRFKSLSLWIGGEMPGRAI